MEEIDLYSQCEGLTGEACIARLETIQAIPDTLPEPQGEDIPSVGGLVLLVLVGAGIWTVVRRQRIIPEQIMPLLPASPAQYIPYPTAPGAPTYTEDEVSEKLADLEYKLTNPFREQPAPVWAPSQPETVANQGEPANEPSPKRFDPMSEPSPNELSRFVETYTNHGSIKDRIWEVWGAKAGDNEAWRAARKRYDDYLKTLENLGIA